MHNVIHTTLLKPFKTRKDPQVEDDQQDHDDEDIIYGVDHIVNSRSRRIQGQKRVEYRIRWEGYQEQDDTWQLFEDLGQGVYPALIEFHQKNPHAAKDQRVVLNEERTNEASERMNERMNEASERMKRANK